MKLIVIEGIECSGKSTLVQKLSSCLQSVGHSVYVFSKDDSPIDYYLRCALSNTDISNNAKLMLMFTRFLEKQRAITINEGEYDYIILDRFDISLFVFAEMIGFGDRIEELRQLMMTVVNPDLYVLCEIDYHTFSLRDSSIRRHYEIERVSQEWFEKKANVFKSFFEKILVNKLIVRNDIDSFSKLKELCLNMY